MALHIKYSSYDSREFPPENHLLHAFVSSLPVTLASYNRPVEKLLSHVDSWHICAKAVQSLSSLNIIFDSEPMVICIQGYSDKTDHGQKRTRQNGPRFRTKRTSQAKRTRLQDKTDHIIGQNGPCFRTNRTLDTCFL